MVQYPHSFTQLDLMKYRILVEVERIFHLSPQHVDQFGHFSQFSIQYHQLNIPRVQWNGPDRITMSLIAVNKLMLAIAFGSVIHVNQLLEERISTL